LVADFFFQPATPVDPALFDMFMDGVVAGHPRADRVRERIRLLRPIFGIKWCCIMLNCFLPELARRSRFADPDHDEEARKKTRLAKAVDALQNLKAAPWLL
jgi:hypothetical protein